MLDDEGSGGQCYLLANDEDQANDDLVLAKKIVGANPDLAALLSVKQKVIERRDGTGFLEILPARDVAGAHGKTYRFCGFDEIHGYRTWDLFEALAPDPTRSDSLQWITSYASIYHKPGVPLYDLMARGRAKTDARMLFSWYAADFTTDLDFEQTDPETRANPSRGAWADQGYLDQQRVRLPAHKFRRLHLNLPGLPEGAAFQPEPIEQAIARGVPFVGPEPGRRYVAFVDMSGGSSDDAVLAIGTRDAEGINRVVRLVNQGPPPPFDPRGAVVRFVTAMQEYGIATVSGDAYAGQTFRADFQTRGIAYTVTRGSASDLYEAIEPVLNAGRVVFPDVPELESQLLGLVWRGGKIGHPHGEHDDYANAAAGVVAIMERIAATGSGRPEGDPRIDSLYGLAPNEEVIATLKAKMLARGVPQVEIEAIEEKVPRIGLAGYLEERLLKDTMRGRMQRAGLSSMFDEDDYEGRPGDLDDF
jgi:hypothetical protein